MFDKRRNTIFKGRSWTCSIRSNNVSERRMPDWTCVFQNRAYKWGKTVVKSRGGIPFCFNIRKPYSRLLALAQIFVTCWFHVRILERVMPRSIKLSRISSGMPLMVRGSTIQGTFGKTIRNFLVFFTFNSILLDSVHSLWMSRSDCNVQLWLSVEITSYIVQSSTYLYVEWFVLTSSIITRKKKSSLVPCGTPAVINYQFDFVCPNLTRNLWPIQ